MRSLGRRVPKPGTMASILDEYEDSLSRSAVLQPGCPSVGIPHSGKEREGALSSPGTCAGRVGRVAPRALVRLRGVRFGSRPLVRRRLSW